MGPKMRALTMTSPYAVILEVNYLENIGNGMMHIKDALFSGLDVNIVTY